MLGLSVLLGIYAYWAFFSSNNYMFWAFLVLAVGLHGCLWIAVSFLQRLLSVAD